MNDYDGVIAEGGTAGCVLARRLTDNGDQKVLLLEAGPDSPTEAETPEELRDASVPAMSHDWGNPWSRPPRGHRPGGPPHVAE